MAQDTVGFDIHLHGEVPLRDDVSFAQLEEALKPLWRYAGAKNLARGAVSAFEEEPGIRLDAQDKTLRMCWTVTGNEDFKQAIDEACMGLNELAREGAALEVSFYDTDFDEDEAGPDEESRDDFYVTFVGPTPAAILQVQRDLMVNDVVHIMSRHFDDSELGGVVRSIDQLFEARLQDMTGAMDISKLLRGPSQGGAGGNSHGGGRKPRHLH
jgi:hypothetical protein